jgi:hypothetical protein
MVRARKTRRQRWALLRSKWLGTAAGLALWTGADATADRALAQTPAAPAAPTHSETALYYLNRQTIQLPIQLDEQFRPILQEIRLYYKDKRSAPWTLCDKATPAQASFTFKAPRDGEYWFTMVTVDREGRCAPSDISREPPAMSIVVDTQPPQTDITRLGSGPEGQLIQCIVRDAHLDPSKTRVQFQTADKVYRDLEALPEQPGVYCIPAQANITGQIRVQSSDQAGNISTRECNLAQLAAAGSAPVAAQSTTTPVAQASAPAPTTTVSKMSGPQMPLPESHSVTPPTTEHRPIKPSVPTSTMPTADKTPAPNLLPPGLDSSPTIGSTAVATPPQAPPQGPPVKVPTATETPIVKASATEPKVAPSMLPKQPAHPAVPQATQSAKPAATTTQPPTIAAKAAGSPVHLRLVNSTRVFLDYRIEQTGASGVGRIDVWCTRDQGQTWQRLCEVHDRKSPAEVQLPGDGVYGLTLVVSNGLGFGARPPAAGDAPDWWIEVDTTQPVAQITTVRLTNEDGPVVHIGWTSKDRNIGATPVDLSYAIDRNGPWLPIAKGLKADGQYRWLPPLDIGKQAFFRLTVRDAAGNTTITETTQPVAIDDLSRPRAVMIGISTDSVVTPPPASSAPPMPKEGGN